MAWGNVSPYFRTQPYHFLNTVDCRTENTDARALWKAIMKPIPGLRRVAASIVAEKSGLFKAPIGSITSLSLDPKSLSTVKPVGHDFASACAVA
jgi:hypothetical protein